MLTLKSLAVWIHLLSMVGTFGAVAFYQLGLSSEQRADLNLAKKLGRLTNLLIGVGLLAGLAAYFLMLEISGGGIPKGYHHSVGTKFVLFLAVGACLGVSTALHRKGRLDTASLLRWVAIALLAVAALLGVSVGS